MKKISLKGLASYMTESEARRRKTLHGFKYPDESGAFAKTIYYRAARDRIVAYHSGENDEEWLTEEVGNLRKLALSSEGARKTRLSNNARALRQYAKHFANKDYEVLGELSMGLEYRDVTVTVYPDLYIKEKGREKIIKLAFSSKEPEAEFIKIISQSLFEAAGQEGLGLKAGDVIFCDVPRGKMYKGAKMGSRMATNIKAACENISAIWETI